MLISVMPRVGHLPSIRFNEEDFLGTQVRPRVVRWGLNAAFRNKHGTWGLGECVAFNSLSGTFRTAEGSQQKRLCVWQVSKSFRTLPKMVQYSKICQVQETSLDVFTLGHLTSDLSNRVVTVKLRNQRGGIKLKKNLTK